MRGPLCPICSFWGSSTRQIRWLLKRPGRFPTYVTGRVGVSAGVCVAATSKTMALWRWCMCVCVCVWRWVGGNLGNMQMVINGLFYVHSRCQQSVPCNFIPSRFSVAGGGRGEGGLGWGWGVQALLQSATGIISSDTYSSKPIRQATDSGASCRGSISLMLIRLPRPAAPSLPPPPPLAPPPLLLKEEHCGPPLFSLLFLI